MDSDFHRFRSGELLGDRWRRHAAERPGAEAIVHWVAGEEPFRWTWGHLIKRAESYASWLTEQGVAPGEVCALIIRHHREFYPLYLGTVLAGALPAVLAYPNSRLHPEKFRQGLEGMVHHSGLDWVLTERELEPVIREFTDRETATVRGLLFPLELAADRHPPTADRRLELTESSPCLLQHSSGTTGLQRAVVLSHAAVLGHLQRYGAAIGVNSRDRVVNWLPLYHDMGLIAAFQLSLGFGIPLIQLDPFEWIQAPVLMLEAMAHEQATLAWMPNFAYHLMAGRIHDDDLEGLRFDHLRLLVNCSEPVRAEGHAAFFDRYAPYGIRNGVLSACYAMAETTFAVTQTRPGKEARRLHVDRQELSQGYVRVVPPGPDARVCVSSGLPIADVVVKVVDPHGIERPEGAVGELVIRSASLFDGYRNNPERTAEVLRDGWYSSGDYGFVHEGECYVIGRKKDIIIVAGKNLYPEDIEDAVGRVPGVLPGRVVAFGVDDAALGTEQVAVVLESAAHDKPDVKELKRAVVEAGMDAGATITRVYVVPPRWLIKSSAGKPSRKANRERALTELTAAGPLESL